MADIISTITHLPTSSIMNGEQAYPFIIGNLKIPLFYIPRENPNSFRITDKKEYNRQQTIRGQAFEHWGDQPASLKITLRIMKGSQLGSLLGIYNEKRYHFEDPMFCTELEVLQAIYHMDQKKLYNLNYSSYYTQKETEKADKKPKLDISVGQLGSLKLTTDTPVSSKKSDSPIDFLKTLQEKFSSTIIYYKSEIYGGFFTSLDVSEDGKDPYFHLVSFDFTVTARLRDYMYDAMDSNVGRLVGTGTTLTALGYIVDSLGSGLNQTIDTNINVFRNINF